MNLPISTDTLVSVIILLVYCLIAYILYTKRINRPIAIQLKDLANASRKSNSPMVVIMHNKQEKRSVFTMIGDKYEIIREITDATDTDPDAEEFMQIISNFYNSKTVTR